MKLNELTIKQASEKLAKKEITSVELTEACLACIAETDKSINALITICEQEALEAAKQADERIAKGEKGKLLGVPYVAKDNILTKGIRTTAASKILDNYIAPYDATIIKKLKKAGAVLLGKANLDEFAHGSSGENSAYGPTKNPWDLERVAGGSCSGPGAAVAADMCLFALGTDTGGSIRCPASFCGVIGLKPTYGRSSRFGLIAMTSSTDVPGPLTKTAEDAAIVLKTMAGHDKNDATTPEIKADDYINKINQNIKGLKIGIPREYFVKGMNKQVEQAVKDAIKKFEEMGAEIVEVSLPYTKYAVPVYYIITPSEISSNLARHDGIRYGLTALTPSSSPARASREKGVNENTPKNLMEVYLKSRGKGFGAEAKRRIMLGTYALSAGYYDSYYLQAQKVRTKIREELDRVLSQVDVLATPTSPNTAFKIGAKSEDPLEMYLEDVFVSSASLAGLPAMSIPCGFADGLPVGMQIIGKRFDEAAIFRVSNNYQQATEWHNKKPKL